MQIKEQQHERPRPAAGRDDAAGHPLRRSGRCARTRRTRWSPSRPSPSASAPARRSSASRRGAAAAAAVPRSPSELVRDLRDQPAAAAGRATSPRRPTTPTGARATQCFTDIAAYEQFNTNGSGAGDALPHRLRRAAGAEGARRHAATCSRCSARRRCSAARSPTTRQCEGEVARRRPELRPVAVGVRRRSGDRRPDDHAQRPRLRRRRRDAARRSSSPAATCSSGRRSATRPSASPDSRRPHWLGVVARLQPGVSLAQARAGR